MNCVKFSPQPTAFSFPFVFLIDTRCAKHQIKSSIATAQHRPDRKKYISQSPRPHKWLGMSCWRVYCIFFKWATAR